MLAQFVFDDNRSIRQEMHRLLIIRGGAVGDFILTLPVLAALRQTLGQAHLEVMGHPGRAVLARHPSYADQITDIEAWALYRLFSRQSAIPERLAGYLRAFDSIIAYLPASADVFADRLRQVSSSHLITCIPHPPTGVHATDHLLQPLRHLCPVPFDPIPQVYLTPDAIAAAEQFWHRANLPASGVLALHPGSGGISKRWPLAGWRHVIGWATRQRIPCLIINGPADQEYVDELLQSAPRAAWACTGTLPLPQLAALIARCRLLIGHDSGITHLAAAVGTHTLALFGPTDPWSWGPRSPHACVLQTQQLAPLSLTTMPPHSVLPLLDAMWQRTFNFAPSHLGFTIRRFSSCNVS